MDIPHKKDKDGIIIQVKVTPGASKRDCKVIDGVLNVKIPARPVDGEANSQLIELLSEIFDVKKGDIVLLRGRTSRNKLIKVKGIYL